MCASHSGLAPARRASGRNLAKGVTELANQGHSPRYHGRLLDLRAVHEPHRDLPSLSVPGQIDLAIAIDVADSGDLPRQRHAGRHDGACFTVTPFISHTATSPV